MFVFFLLKFSWCIFVNILVSQFARKTGDYTNLSAVDLNLIALTYQLCKENMDKDEFDQLKQEPIKNYVIIKKHA